MKPAPIAKVLNAAASSSQERRLAEGRVSGMAPACPQGARLPRPPAVRCRIDRRDPPRLHPTGEGKRGVTEARRAGFLGSYVPVAGGARRWQAVSDAETAKTEGVQMPTLS